MYSAAVLALAGGALAVNNGLARTPQMGWNNWNSLGCDVSQDLLLDTAKILVNVGLKDVGYNYVVLDDCWQDPNQGRDARGKVVVDKKKFPKGMNFISDELHKAGLLYGMYSSAGEMTCARYAGSLDYEQQDADSYASWGVDYLKYDNCYHMGRFGTPEISFNRFKVMADALNNTGRNILYSLCNWGEDYAHTWGMSIANSWRMSGDIYDSFTRPDDKCPCTVAHDPHCVAPGTHCSVLNIVNKVAPYVDRGQPGGWNDLDMLEVGVGGMSDEEYKAHFALWAAIKSIMLIGADIRDLPASALSILNNPAIIAINQDPMGKAVERVSRNFNVKKDKYGQGETHVWSGPLANGDQIVLIVNAADEEMELSADLEDIFINDGPGGSAKQIQEKWNVHDLWGNRMSETDAQQLIDAKPEEIQTVAKRINWYNSTEIPYSEGLKNEDPRLFGKKIGTAGPGGAITAMVPRHGAAVYRLRPASPTGWRKGLYKDEL